MTKMARKISAALAAACWLFSTAAAPAPDATIDRFVGHWALVTDGGAFITLDLRRGDGPAGAITGEFDQPKHYQATRNGVFTSLSGPVAHAAVVGLERSGEAISFLLAAPGAAADKDRLEMRLMGNGEATLAYRDHPDFVYSLHRAPKTVAVPKDWDPDRSYVIERRLGSNPEMTQIFVSDQSDREHHPIDWSRVDPRDAARRDRTRALLAAGALTSGEDFEHAAFVFQHGDLAGDYLMAHTLAMVAMSKGRPGASWIAAATLDRYLQTIGQKQIYGTQYRREGSGPVTQDPYDRTLIADALRAELGVPSIAAQTRPESMPAGAQPSAGVSPASPSSPAAGRSK